LPGGQEVPKTEQDEVLLEAAMAREISHLFRYMRGYFRKALRSNKSVITMDDYTYLVCLLRIPMMTKTELNNLNVMEKTSGTEVINRLLRRGLIEQHVNEEDHRSFYVSITEKGREEVTKLFPELKKIVTIFFSGITLPQKIVLHQLHQRLFFLLPGGVFFEKGAGFNDPPSTRRRYFLFGNENRKLTDICLIFILQSY